MSLHLLLELAYATLLFQSSFLTPSMFLFFLCAPGMHSKHQSGCSGYGHIATQYRGMLIGEQAGLLKDKQKSEVTGSGNDER